MHAQLANIHNRTSIEAVYPEQVWEQDAANNSVPTADVHHGLLIRTACDAKGSFEVHRIGRNVGEEAPEHDALFLCPYMGKAANLFVGVPGVHGAYALRAGADMNLVEDYKGFIDRVIEAARGFGRAPGSPTAAR
ncbi:MAG TPA: hypothetical protein VMQ11_18935 [Alphaproteobacteria bacterium]|nr:hypothetical protein [Alphaproteobacteria bacterium]